MQGLKYLSGARQGVSDYSIKLDQAKMTLEIFACLDSHCVHLCIVWPKLPKKNFTSISLGNHISVHISQGNLPLSIPSDAFSIDQTSLRNHYKWCNFPGIFVKDSSIFHYKGDVPASIHSKGKIHIVTRGNEHGLTSQHHYWAHKGKTRGRSGSENGKGNKAERTKLYFELLNIIPRHCCTCASPLFPFNLSPQGPSEPCKLLTYFAVCTNSWS